MFSKDQSGIRAEHRLELGKSNGIKKTNGEAAAVLQVLVFARRPISHTRY